MNEDNGDNDGPAKRSLITDQMIADIRTTSDPVRRPVRLIESV